MRPSEIVLPFSSLVSSLAPRGACQTRSCTISDAVTKTNAVRILERLGIPFQLKPYEVDESDLSATTVALKVGLPLEQVFKTLLVRGDRRGLAFAVVPGDGELDLKALAHATGDAKWSWCR